MSINYNKYFDSDGTHYIANSGSDENKRYHGGKAGDQTGHEAELKPWYNRPWSVVLRHTDPAVGIQIAKLEIAMCLNNNVGYDQYQRTTYWKQLVLSNYDPSAITVPCEQDCTCGTTANVKAAGHIMCLKKLEDIPIDTYSGNMRKRFVAAGFRALTASKYLSSPNYLLPGDVLLYENHHAAVNITYGKYAEKSNTKIPSASEMSSFIPTDYILVNGAYYIRNEPSKNGAIEGLAKSGDKLAYMGVTKDGWRNVLYNGNSYWISGRSGTLVKNGIKKIVSKKGNWYIRSKPDKNAQKLAYVNEETTLYAFGNSTDGWYSIVYRGTTAYISEKAIKN